MSHLADLIAQANSKDPHILAGMELWLKQLPSPLAFGLNFECHSKAKTLAPKKFPELAGLNPSYTSSIDRGLRKLCIENFAKHSKASDLIKSEPCKGVVS